MPFTPRFYWTCLALLLLTSSFLGCGRGTGPRRYDISGQVTYQGAPVPLGEISFDPVDQEYGGGYASIQDGRFDTSADGGRGHLGGPHQVRIVGFEGTFDPAQADDAAVSALFSPYETTVELPTGRSTMDFEVPADAGP